MGRNSEVGTTPYSYVPISSSTLVCKMNHKKDNKRGDSRIKEGGKRRYIGKLKWIEGQGRLSKVRVY